jgi:hypothetical protein
LRGVSADGYVMVLAAIFILVVLFLPKGIAGLFERVASELGGRLGQARGPSPAEQPSSPALLPAHRGKGALTSGGVAHHEPLALRTGRGVGVRVSDRQPDPPPLPERPPEGLHG